MITYTMNSAVKSFCIYLIFSAAVKAAPVILQHVSEVSLIISDSCMGQSDSRDTQAVAMSNAIAANRVVSSVDTEKLNHLDNYLNEISEFSQEIQKNHSDWLTPMPQIISPIKQIISVVPVRHCELTMEQNTQLYVMTQLSIFANYIRSKERDEAYPDDVKSNLIKLKNTLYEAICQLKNFLLQQSVVTGDIDKYVTNDYTQPWLSVNNEKGALRRAVVMAELNILSQFLESFTYNSTSVALKNNNFATPNCG